MSLESTLEASLAARVPVLIWGPPGVGKSAAVAAWAAERGLRCWTVIASLREPSDFGGLPVVDATTGAVRFAPPRFAQEAQVHGGLIFLDELTTAPPAVQAALLRAVVDRAFGDLELDPARVALVAAANPPGEAAGGWELAPPLANRFAHVRYDLRVGEWTERFPGYWGAPPRLEFGAERLDEAAWALSRSVVASFIRARPGLLLALPRDEAKRGEAWPSPRTWDYASRLLAATGNGKESDLAALAACLGEGAALEFATWRRALDLPDPEELLRDPASYRHADRKDLAYAVLSAVVQTALQRLDEDRWRAAWHILGSAARAGGADVGAAAARSLARARTPALTLPTDDLKEFMPMLRSAGMMG